VINQGESVFNDSLAAFSALSDGKMHKSFLHTLKMNTAEVGQCG
jgi:sodium transport system ATP-binding protein